MAITLQLACVTAASPVKHIGEDAAVTGATL